MTDLAPADPYRVATRVQIDGVPLAVIRHDGVTLDQIEEFFDADYSVLNAAAAAGRIRIAGPPVAVYHGDPLGEFDVEIGMPVATAVDGYPEFASSTLPSGTASVLTHMGSYGTLGASWASLVRSAETTPTGDWVELYLTEPGVVPVERMRTDLVLYVED